MTSDTPKYAIEIEAIKTPKGLVPTVESLKRIVKGLNLLDADLGRMNLKMEANIRALLREVKTLQKLVADDTIASESSVERLGVLANRFETLEKTMDKMASVEQRQADVKATLEKAGLDSAKARGETLNSLQNVYSPFLEKQKMEMENETQQQEAIEND